MAFGLADFLREVLVLKRIIGICTFACSMLACGFVDVFCPIHHSERDLYIKLMLSCYVNELSVKIIDATE